MSIHMMKLVVGIDSLEAFAALQARETFAHEGQLVVPCWTRFSPKRADEIVRNGGSLYRVIKGRIQCRQRILGFEMVETQSHGRRCMILQDPDIIETVHMAHRAFQGWRYLEPAKAPADRGPYVIGQDGEIPPADMEEDLRAAGLL